MQPDSAVSKQPDATEDADEDGRSLGRMARLQIPRGPGMALGSDFHPAGSV